MVRKREENRRGKWLKKGQGSNTYNVGMQW